MMYLSRLQLTARAQRSESFWRIAGSPYRLHQESWRLFGAGPEAPRDFLYRFEGGDERGPLLYGLSPRPVKDPEGLWSIQSKPFAPKLRTGSQLAFCVRVNPVRQRNGKRHDVVMDAKHRMRAAPVNLALPMVDLIQAELESWIGQRGETRGFRSLGLRAEGYRLQEFRKRGNECPIRIATCDLEGILEVVDPELFLASVSQGLGPAKAFGCGLFLLRRA